MIQRSGEVVLNMLANVQQATIAPFLKATIALGTTVYTDEYDIYSRLKEWGYKHLTVNHGKKEYARDDATARPPLPFTPTDTTVRTASMPDGD